MKFRRFTKTKFLTQMGRELLGQFLARFQTGLKNAGVELPKSDLADEAYFAALATLFEHPDGLPGEMNEVLFAIDALSNEDGQERLEEAAKKEIPELKFDGKSSRPDIALQVWLVNPKGLARVHNEARLTRLSSFEFHGTASPVNRSGTLQLPDKTRHAALVKAVDEHPAGRG